MGAIGGCTVHSFLFPIYPSDSDFDHIAAITGDRSWTGRNMRKYFERLERCRYVTPLPGDGNPSGHGFAGWLPTEIPNPKIFALDQPIPHKAPSGKIVRLLEAAFEDVYQGVGKAKLMLAKWFDAELDPNDARDPEQPGGLLQHAADDAGRQPGGAARVHP